MNDTYKISVTVETPALRVYEQFMIERCDFVTMCQVIEALQYFKERAEKRKDA